MSHENDLIIFDLDGTILDTIVDLGNAANYALKMRGLPLHSADEYPRLVGNGIRNLVKRSIPEQFRDDDGFVDSALADFKGYYSAHIYEETKPFPGIKELLAELQQLGFKLAVASNKFDEGVVTLINHFFPDINFCAVIGNRPGIPLKPSPDIVNLILDNAFNLSQTSHRAILVGDSEVDIQTASRARIPVIAVTWGLRDRESLFGANRIADNACELGKYILELTSN